MGTSRSIIVAFAGCLWSFSFGQCPNNNVLTGGTITPACPGTTNVPCVQGGQFARVNVVAGNTYTFSTCAASFDTEITLINNTGGVVVGYNDDACGATGFQSTITWTATFTGLLRVLVDQFPCATNAICAPLVIVCTTPPVGDCIYTLTLFDSFSDGWGTSLIGVSINGGPYTNYTVPPGVPSVTFQIGVFIGDVIVLNYNASGAFQTDNSYILSLAGGALFNSGTPPAAGINYTGTVDCLPPPPAPEDCLGAMTICSNVAFNNNTTNTGNIVDISAANSGCLDPIENQGTWYIFSPSVGGNLGFTIAPLGPDDYDWAIWGPYPQGSTLPAICPPSGPPIRCAASSGPATQASTGSYDTGMGHATYSPPQFASTAVSYAIPATTNICPLIPPQRCGWVPGMQVTVGQIFLMYISNWSLSSTGFSLNWNLQAGASLDCTVLPVELMAFDAVVVGEEVELRWVTASESGTDHFVVERSGDGDIFESIGSLSAAGNSVQTTHYDHLDPVPLRGLSYYRLRQVDTDGTYAYSQIRTVFFQQGAGVLLQPNPGSGWVDVLVAGGSGSLMTMLDATGRTVLLRALESDRTTIDTSTLPNGLYGIRVHSTSGANTAWVSWVKK